MVSISSTIGFVWRQENLRLRRDLELSRAMLSRQGDPETKFRGRFGAVSKRPFRKVVEVERFSFKGKKQQKMLRKCGSGATEAMISIKKDGWCGTGGIVLVCEGCFGDFLVQNMHRFRTCLAMVEMMSQTKNVFCSEFGADF